MKAIITGILVVGAIMCVIGIIMAVHGIRHPYNEKEGDNDV